MRQTIFALASGLGRCGVSVIRISGPKCASIYEQLTLRPANSLQPKQLHTVSLYNGVKSECELIDKGMAVFFAGPKSFTGEDVLELHVHGAPAVIDALYSFLHKHGRVARAGEFAERAFHSGKLALREVEGLADLLAAETASQRRQALWLMNGGGDDVLTKWRQQLVECLAKMEAFIDFSEDEHIESAVVDECECRVSHLIHEISNQLNKRNGEIIRTGYKVVICGRPNAGKSSLFNELIGRKAAIVSTLPGTTRDVLQVNLDLHGLPVVLFDTAGVREAVLDDIEAEGVLRAKQAAQSADLVIQLIDPGDAEVEQEDPSSSTLHHQNVIKVYNKSDLYEASCLSDKICISCKSKQGIDILTNLLYERLSALTRADCRETPLITRSRHRRHLLDCVTSLQEFLSTGDVVLRTECLRQATQDMGRVSGKVECKDILDTLFQSFCIGK